MPCGYSKGSRDKRVGPAKVIAGKRFRLARSYTEFKFMTRTNARKKAMEMKRKYGYMPSVFKITHPRTRKVKFVVVRPMGLKRI